MPPQSASTGSATGRPDSRSTPSEAATRTVPLSQMRLLSLSQNTPCPCRSRLRSWRQPQTHKREPFVARCRRASSISTQPWPARSMWRSSSQIRPAASSSWRSMPRTMSGYSLMWLSGIGSGCASRRAACCDLSGGEAGLHAAPYLAAGAFQARPGATAGGSGSKGGDASLSRAAFSAARRSRRSRFASARAAETTGELVAGMIAHSAAPPQTGNRPGRMPESNT
mgnify:CR=1 FL=1